MTLKEVAEILEAEVLTGHDKLDEIVVERVAAADMMSDVLAFSQPKILLITGLNTPQVPRTVSIVDGVGAVIVRKNMVPQTTIDLAKALGIPLLHSRLSMFEACGRLYQKGLKPVDSLS
ncbi:MAG: hypothetical protein PWP37_60 [Thermotogota bacterium]|nr:hypothetical protein [Thermotogota bacterium]MDK2863868.1 hypothetical protein [Thermotogota bacterium]HCZ07137.1 hypothetical protein [Thermotogota bacterium]